MFTKFAVWIMVFSNYPPPANHIHIGEVKNCNQAPQLVDDWIEKYFKPKDYYGWVCLSWDKHLKLINNGRFYQNRVMR